jgi:roadblock/LC7 domain-containing protein
LLDLEGVVVADEFDFEGRMLDYEAEMDMSEEMTQMAAQFCAAVCVMLNTMASSFADRSGMTWVPQHGWAYSGGVDGVHRRRWQAGSVRRDVQGRLQQVV